MSKRFFISHAGPDKPLAIDLKALLEDDAWVDLHEIDLGDVLWHEISDGIEAATDFVLLWSAASARSKPRSTDEPSAGGVGLIGVG